ncbi:MAG TPA: OmpA family protein [Erythrobacter sp.]|nr:OmpA family protein [Erythrobacter sp.]
MSVISRKSGFLLLLAASALPMTAGVAAQNEDYGASEDQINVYGSLPTDLKALPDGPELEGFISARNGNRVQVTSAGGTKTVVNVAPATEIRTSGGFLGLSREKLGTEALLNGLPVTVSTVQWEGGLVASRIALKGKDLRTAAMIRNGTDQRFGENETAIAANAAATEALRGRMGDIDKYNIKGTTNVYFDTGKWQLSAAAQRDLCTAANEAKAIDNALLLVVGYTDSTGSYEINQTLSEKRAGRVVNFLQQECDWEPWRMLTPTGMASADPLADNSTPEGKAQNRRVSVNILVSKSIDGI